LKIEPASPAEAAKAANDAKKAEQKPAPASGGTKEES
jgi:hypothetical protein